MGGVIYEEESITTEIENEGKFIYRRMKADEGGCR